MAGRKRIERRQCSWIAQVPQRLDGCLQKQRIVWVTRNRPDQCRNCPAVVDLSKQGGRFYPLIAAHGIQPLDVTTHPCRQMGIKMRLPSSQPPLRGFRSLLHHGRHHHPHDPNKEKDYIGKEKIHRVDSLCSHKWYSSSTW